MQHKLLALSLCAVLSVSFNGCSGPPSIELKLAPASGTVTLDGKPLPNAIVKFNPDGGAKPSTGQTDSNGEFTMTTSETGDGAILGKHKVTVIPQPSSVPDSENLTAESYEVPDPKKQTEGGIPAKYASIATSGLEADVKAGEDNVFEFKLTSK